MISLTEFFNLTVEEMNKHFKSLGGIDCVVSSKNSLSSLGIYGNPFNRKVIKKNKVGKVDYVSISTDFIVFGVYEKNNRINVVAALFIDFIENKVTSINKVVRNKGFFKGGEVEKLILCL